ncbi:MAG TPA: histidine phosphatase family protein [Acidimicrobiales bacterium]|nr:histidine phosphatase family protein [Acidimicrobiales bacterium]
MPRADSTTGTRPDNKAAQRPQPPPATVVLLVRHGTTTTTGKELPGRAPGLHLAESGVRQAEDVAARIVRVTSRPDGSDAATADPSPEPPVPAPEPGAGGPTAGGAAASGNGSWDGDGHAEGMAEPAPSGPRGVAAVYASPLDRTRETAASIAAAVGREVLVDDDLIELDVGDWTGMALSEAREKPEWKTIQRYPSGFTFPGGESFVAMQARMITTLEKLRRRHPGETVVAVSHADPIRAVVAHAMGTHLDMLQRVVVSPCSLTAIALGETGPVVLTVNATGDPGGLVPS